MFSWATALLLLHIGLATGLSLRVLYRQLAVQTALAWIVLLIAMPVAGAVLYGVFGEHSLGRRRMRQDRRIRAFYQKAYAVARGDSVGLGTVEAPFGALAASIMHDSGFPVLAHNRYAFLRDAGAIFDAMCVDIDQAQTICSLEFYIIDPAGRVADVLGAVLRATARGVDCRILADDFGSSAFFRSDWPARLRAAGVRVVRSLPVGLIKSLSKRTDLRNHRKLLICDRCVAYTGSMNLVDPALFKPDAHVGEWIDLVMRIEGQMVDALACLFNADFLLEERGADLARLTFDAHQAPLPDTTTLMQLLPSGPEMPHSTIYEWIVAAVFNARVRVRIVTPYFIPDQAVMLALTSAARRGVKVEIIVPERVDTRLGQYASQAAYADLLAAGVTILRFSGGLLHAKAVLIDQGVSLFGTVNMDMRSFYLNLELSLIAYDTPTNTELSAIFDDYAAHSAVLTRSVWSRRGPRQRFLESLIRLAGPLL